MARSFAPSLLVLATLIALVLPQLEQKEIFAEALLNGPTDKVNNWRTALKEAANLEGFHLEPDRPEPEFIEEIVDIIWKILYVESPTSTIPPWRQNDVPGQYSSLIIPQKRIKLQCLIFVFRSKSKPTAAHPSPIRLDRWLFAVGGGSGTSRPVDSSLSLLSFPVFILCRCSLSSSFSES
ncbi:hypothetical protein CMV_010930 [Castanea mollissima]|uniref:TIR domain-containing protein n=1 Tax=Castanea mollissima TaxID=60419 RepID=A0A8J4VP92_9ROSI|nr:hypothetical protein CMV_010930 [Castanea mollissima]